MNYKNGQRILITENIIEKVKSLLHSKSQRNIADELKISQYTVWAIANDKYGTGRPLQHDRKVKESYFRHF